MNLVSDHFGDIHNQKMFLHDFSVKQETNHSANQKQNQINFTLNSPQQQSNQVPSGQHFAVMLDQQYNNNNMMSSVIHNQNSNSMPSVMYTDSLPIVDLVQKNDEPFVVCKLPIHVYNRVLEMMQLSMPVEQIPSHSTPPHMPSSPMMNNPFVQQHQQVQHQAVNNMIQQVQQVQQQQKPIHIHLTTPPSTPSTPMSLPLMQKMSTTPNNVTLKDELEFHIKGSWTEEEDKKLVELVKKYGAKRWSFIASHLKGRIGKQCRERYLNHLDPKINKKAWTNQEDSIIVEMHTKHGNQWAKISRCLPGRTANAIKNHWNSTLSRRHDKARPGESPSQDLGEDSLSSNEDDEEPFSAVSEGPAPDVLRHVVINPPVQMMGAGFNNVNNRGIMTGFNNQSTSSSPYVSDMPKFELYSNANFVGVKRKLRMDEGVSEESIGQFDDIHLRAEDSHHNEEPDEKRFKTHVLDLEGDKLKLESEERIFNPFGQSYCKSPTKQLDSQSGKYNKLSISLDETIQGNDYDFESLNFNTGNMSDSGLLLGEDSSRGAHNMTTRSTTPTSSTPTNLNSLTPSGSNQIQHFFSESLWSPKSVKNSSSKKSTFVACS
ncbi:hypothetical protein AKO1_003772 [Acrasis kona]|uniref:Uncharacterized protein n=1 Tax=Acrasis kona TaxID=1008807 RepID=A0AAW2Z7T9_9EUKA